MNRKFPIKERVFLLIVFMNAFIFGLFFTALLVGIDFGRLLTDDQKIVTQVFDFPEAPDNVYLWSSATDGQPSYIRVYHYDGEVTDTYRLLSSGIGDGSSSFTSELIDSTSGIKKIEISGGENRYEVGSVSSGHMMASVSSAVLGVNTGETKIATLFLEKSGIEVVSRSEWGAPTSDETVEDNKLVNIESIDLYSISNPNGESDLQSLKATYEYHKSRCINAPGVAPVSCLEDSTFDDISFNYIVGYDGEVYEGRLGGNGVPGLHDTDEVSAISVALISKSGSYSPDQLKKSKELLTILAGVNGFEIDSKTLRYVSIKEDDPLEEFIPELYSTTELTEDSTSTETEQYILASPVMQISKAAEEMVEEREYVKVGEEVQVLISTEVNEEVEEVLDRVGAAEVEELEGGLVETYVEETILEQTLSEVMLADNDIDIQLNYIYKVDTWDNVDPNRSIPSDYDTGTHWHLEKIKAPEVWSDLGGCTADNSCGGDQSVIVAVLDTGVAYEDFNYDAGDNFTAVRFDPFWVEVPGSDTPDGDYNEGYDREHLAIPEFSNINFVSPYDAWQHYSCNSLRLTGASPKPCNSAEAAKINHPNDDHGHGSFVTSIIAANTSDSAPNKLAGIAHNVSIMPVKVFTPNDTSMCYDSYGDIDPTCSYIYGDYRSVAFTTTLVTGINHAVANGAKVINMSLGGPGSDSLVENAITNALTAGTMIVVASGNDGDDTEYYFPANAPGAFTVGATDESDVRAAYSNYGGELSLVAPVGGSTGSYTPGIRYTCSTTSSCDDETNSNLFKSFTSTTTPNTGIGTSYAAPQVAAAAALLWSDDPTATLNEIEAALKNSANDLGPAGYDEEYGYGLLDIEAALAREQNVDDPPQPSKQYFTWYDTKKDDRNAWILVGNPSTTVAASVQVRIGGILMGSQTIDPGGRWGPEWRGVQNGPVEVTSSIPVYTTQRSKVFDSFNEYAGIPESEFATKFYFTWYDTKRDDRNAWILVGNPSTTVNANVEIRIGGTLMGSQTIGPGGRWTPEWRGVQNGPVEVSSDNPVYATQRSKVYGTFNEYAGIPESAFSTKFYFTWYDTKFDNRNAWILVGNPSSSLSANVEIRIGGTLMGSETIAPGSRWTPEWRGVQNGPVEVTSDIPVYATQRARVYGTFNEYAGIPESAFSDQYYFTWYDTKKDDRNAWILVGNPSSSQSANVEIRIGGTLMGSQTITPGGRWAPEWRGVQNGPVEVTSDIPVYTTQRAKVYGTFNEYPGIVSTP